MSVHSTFFGVTKLTGKDAENFRRQAAYGRPNENAIASHRRAKALLRAVDAKGQVRIKAKKRA